MLGKVLILASFFLWPQVSGASDKSKKAYELIYEDVQLLKKQTLALEQKLERAGEDLRAMKDQLKEIQSQIKLFQSDQAGLQGELKKIPSQYQVFLEKLELVSHQLNRISEDLLVIKGAPATAGPELEKKAPLSGTATPSQSVGSKPAGQAEKKSPAAPLSNLSPQEVYNMAYNDYLGGNFDLAVDGFRTYIDHFPDSPLADNALYWIGECHFSQRKFDAAVNTFNELILNYPQGDKVAAAHLKKGISLLELGKKEEALAVFKLLVSKYPFEEETKIAQQKIKELTSR